MDVKVSQIDQYSGVLLKGFGTSVVLSLSLLSGPLSAAVTLEDLAEKMDKLEAENRELRKNLNEIKTSQAEDRKQYSTHQQVKPSNNSGSTNVVNVNNKYSFDVLDPTTKINRKQLLILEQKQSGALQDNTVIIGGAVTAVVDKQHTDTDSKFGYLMRHPTANNQAGSNVSEAVLHSVQLGITANLGSWLTAYSEILYDPGQSFGRGTMTALSRNQLQMRQGYILLGDLNKSPFYLSLGKMATPFGLTDTVNPFTASTLWHAFGGLAYGIKGGYFANGFNVELMGVQGGSQFRGANTSVGGTAVPSKLNNYVVDVNYTYGLGNDNDVMAGVSYEKGSTYCHNFPVIHFSACTKDNPAYDVYSQVNLGNFMFIAEFAKTAHVWPGTFNPTLPQFEAKKVTSWGVGGKYSANLMGNEIDFSADYSRFISGPDGSPWERQDQTILGVSGFLTPSVKLFGEYIHVDGYVPLNFLSGGNLGPGQTHSVRDADSDVILFGVNAAF